MSLAETTVEIEYPESDGKPVAETELHFNWTVRIRDILKHRYRSAQVYVGADLLIYFVEGDPTRVVAPDVFVVKDCDPGMRRTFKTWEERRVPNVVLEVTSKGTSKRDQIFKPLDYAEIGIEEFFLYDPSAEYLRPSLCGHRLQGSGYEPIEPNSRGLIECRSLGITLELDGRDLIMRDMESGAVLLTSKEAAEAELVAANSERDATKAERDVARAEREAAKVERDAALAQRDLEHVARQAAEARAVALEEELRRLRASQDAK